MLIPYERFCELFSAGGFSPTKELYLDFSHYAYLLSEWNKRINLTAITDPQEIAEKHFLDSALLLRQAEIPQEAAVIDVGTGAGFPGIPLKLLRRDICLTLLDSLNKRISFLSTVSEELNLDAICVHMRAEDAGQHLGYREQFDFATARAVAALPVLAEYCLPLVKVGGVFAAMKGPSEDISAAKEAVSALGGEIAEVKRYSLPCGDERVAVIIKKLSPTPKQYPRKSGRIKKGSIGG